jgi:hypothetical protein
VPWQHLYFTRHARNKMRWYRVSLEDVKRCIDVPEVKTVGSSGKINCWTKLGKNFLRVTVTEEGNRLIVITVTIRRKGPRREDNEDNL